MDIMNEAWEDATVYICWTSTSCRRLGIATGKLPSTFRTQYRPDSFYLRADFLSIGPSHSLEEFVEPSARLSFTLSSRHLVYRTH